MKPYAFQFEKEVEIPARKRKSTKVPTRRESRKEIEKILEEDRVTRELIDINIWENE